MSVQVEQYYTDSFLRNFIYFIRVNEEIICIDPFDAKCVKDYLGDEITKLKVLINTHEHPDHIGGNEELKNELGLEIWAHKNGKGKIPGVTKFLEHGEKIKLDEEHYIEVLDTPGHTFAHLCFVLYKNNKAECIFTGDTLFNAGVGHCKLGGDPEVLFETVCNQLKGLPEDIKIYPGHEYLLNNLKFTLDREEDNEKAKNLINEYDCLLYTSPSPRDV